MSNKRAKIVLEAVVYEKGDEEIESVVITGAMFSCIECRSLKPATEFGLRMTRYGVVRNWVRCKSCRVKRTDESGGEGRMPTPKPPKMEEPKDDQERLARLGAVKLVESICQGLHNCAYGTRSHMPGNVDCTDFMNALYKVTDFCNNRPDWTLEIVTKALGERQDDGT